MLDNPASNSVRVTSSDLYGIMNSLSYLSQMALPVLAAMWVRGAVRVFMPLVEDVDHQRRLLLDRHAMREGEDEKKVVDEKGNVAINPETEEAFRAEVAALLDMEHEVICKPLNAKWLLPQNPVNEVLIQPAMIAALEDLRLIVVTE